MASVTETTRLLHEACRGDAAASERLWSAVYGELRSIAERQLRKERRDHTLQPTALLWIVTHHGLTAAPDLAVEVLSDATRRRDVGPKLDAYEKYRVREYWIVDPEERCVDVYVRRRGKLALKIEAASGKVASPLVLPGFSASLAKLFS